MRSDITDRVTRCAIYTRKSTNEGLDLEFNSIDAQRESCEAYILSQRGEGWMLVDTHYDDGGYSGGNTERPALTRLLSDIRAGHIDMIVLYKIDRLTRNLTDFAKMIETLDSHGCSFVSITQSFNTQTSMGRLTLNMLLSFAQFEREVGSERIRDKIAASKAKGMWTGGAVPFGYDVVDRKLVVNASEAATVRKIMRLYLKLGSVRDLVIELRGLGILTKRRVNRVGGTPFQKTALYTLLRNETYLGRTKHHDRVYPGRHRAIVGRRLWDQVQAMLLKNVQEHRTRVNRREPSLLAGIIFDKNGGRISPTHTSKKGRRYHYYATTADWLKSDVPERVMVRAAAEQVDETVRDLLVGYFTDSVRRADECLAAGATVEQVRLAVTRLTALADEARDAPRALLRSLLDKLDAKIFLGEKAIEVRLCGNAIEAVMTAAEASGRPPVILTADVKLSWSRRIPHTSIAPKPVAAKSSTTVDLIRFLGRAEIARHKLFEGKARMSRKQARHLSHLARFSYLAPDIVQKIVDREQPSDLTVSHLTTLTFLPIEWAAQRQMLGFS